MNYYTRRLRFLQAYRTTMRLIGERIAPVVVAF